MNFAGDVERDVEGATVVSGQGGVHELVARSLAVQIQVEEAEAANVGRRPSEFPGDLELVAQHSRWQTAMIRPANLERLVGFLTAVQTDPPGGPVPVIKHAHAPPRRRAPGRDLAILVPDPHFPPASGVRRQRFAGISHMQRLVRSDLTTFPKRLVFLV